ncbi:MAG: ATP-binding cassette domain-containing protein [Eubacterium sp.]|nr:ATP-binding cassette domain-containing protein [Eubacterium sp.]
MEAFTVKNLSFAYPQRANNALDGVTFSVEKGELCVLLGKSASGKSTLLKLIKKELAPHGKLDGEITVNGTVGYVSQRAEESIVTNRVRSELAFSPSCKGMSADDTELLVAEAASYFNLESKLDCDVSELSGGEKQVLALASVMIAKPEILVLDEPVSQLDPVSAAAFYDVIRQMHRDFHTTIIMAEHTLEGVYDMADSVLVLDDGRLFVKAEREEAVKLLLNSAHDMKNALPAKLRADVISEEKAEPILDETALTAKNLCFAYTKGNDVLSGLSLKIYKNKINAIVGPNASGKSTLLKVLCGVKKQYRGSVKADGKTAMLTQNVYDLFTHDTCGEEAEFGEITAFLEIDDIRDYHPYDISGGQAQRLALAKVLQVGADIIMLDEPTKGFDCVLKDKLAQLLKRLCDEDKTVVIVTHDLEFAGRCADVCSFLSRGRIIATKPTFDFFSNLNFYTTPLARLTDGKRI